MGLTPIEVVVSLFLEIVVVSLSVILFGVGLLLLPLSLFMTPRSFTRIYLYIADYYWKFAVWYGEKWVGLKFYLYGDDVPLRENALVISNHRWAVDFIVYWMLAARKGRLGCLKLMAKDWLKFFPGFGWGGYLLDFVFLKREWAQDQSTIKATFNRLKTRNLPFWLLNHVEGTRITPSKLRESQEFSRQRSLPVMTQTLVPRVKGFVAIIQELRDIRPEPLVLYDTTLMYVDRKTGATQLPNGHPVPGPSMWSLFYAPSSDIHVHVKRYTMDQLPKNDADLERWLIDAFVEKNKILEEFHIKKAFPNPISNELKFPSMAIPP